MDVNPVQQRTRDAFLVLGHDHVRAGAWFDWVAVVAARTRVHRRDQLEVGREGQRALRPADGHKFVFERLAQYFQDTRPKLGQFVQEEHAAVGQ